MLLGIQAPLSLATHDKEEPLWSLFHVCDKKLEALGDNPVSIG